MNTQKVCQHCGTALSADAPGGCCPVCMMKVAIEAGTVGDAVHPAHSFTPPTVEELRDRFPSLEIIEFIGRGGMGAVYKARQKDLDRIVALKILPPDIGKDPAFAERFAREARAMAKLNHPGIVTIHEFGRADDLYFFLMEFVDGVTLRRLLQRGRVAPREALAIVPAICDALQYAHDQGIVHRDIKPENILIDRRGRVKVADFGLAKLIASGAEPALTQPSQCSPDLTEAGKVMGTPNYIAPEQVSHPQEVDHRADIYSLGVVFYQMLTGELPGKSLEAPSKKVHIDVRLDEVVLRALEHDPERRYQQASVLKSQVETISQGASAAVPPTIRSAVPFTAESVRGQFLALTIAWWIGFPLSIVCEFVRTLDLVVLAALIVATVFGCILLYRQWLLLQGHGARTTPGRAVGFSFIPVFFFYWWFVAYAGLATDTNRRLKELGIRRVQMSRGLAIAYCILGILGCTIGAFSYVGIALTIPLMVVGFFLLLQQRDCVLALLEAEAVQPFPSEKNLQARAEQGTGSPSVPGSVPVGTAATQPASRLSWAAVAGLCCLLLSMIVAAILVPFSIRIAGPNEGPPTWFVFIAGLPGLLLVLATMVFGAIGIGQTRRHPGKYHGFGLAFFDLLLFPLLTLGIAVAILLGKNTGLQDIHIFLFVLLISVPLAVLSWRLLRPAPEAFANLPDKRPWGMFMPITALVAVTALVSGAVISQQNALSLEKVSPEPLRHRPDLLGRADHPAVIKAALGDPNLPWGWQELQRRAAGRRLTFNEGTQIVDGMSDLLEAGRADVRKPMPWFNDLVKELRHQRLVSEEEVIRCVRAMHGNPIVEVPRVRAGSRTISIDCRWRDAWHQSFLGFVMLTEMQAVTLDGVRLERPTGGTQQPQPRIARFYGDFLLPTDVAPGKHVIKCGFYHAIRPEEDVIGLAHDAVRADWPSPSTPKLASITDFTSTTTGELVVIGKDEQPIELTTDPALDPLATQGLALKAFVRSKGPNSRTVDILFSNPNRLKVPVSFDVTINVEGKTYGAGWYYCFATETQTTIGGSELHVEIAPPVPSTKAMDVMLSPNRQVIEHLSAVRQIWGAEITMKNVPLVRQDISSSR